MYSANKSFCYCFLYRKLKGQERKVSVEEESGDMIDATVTGRDTGIDTEKYVHISSFC